MRSREYGHNLLNLWRCFKEKEAGPAFDAVPTLDLFDATIFALHEFEEIRYPDKIRDAAMGVMVTWHPDDAVEVYSGTQPAHKYEVFISEVDGLIIEILDRIPLNPKYLVGKVGNIGLGGREALQFRNPHAARWV
jgi:hypothetical protein